MALRMLLALGALSTVSAGDAAVEELDAKQFVQLLGERETLLVMFYDQVRQRRGRFAHCAP